MGDRIDYGAGLRSGGGCGVDLLPYKTHRQSRSEPPRDKDLVNDPWLLCRRKKMLKGSGPKGSSSSWLSRRLVAMAQEMERRRGGNDCEEYSED